MSDSLGDGRRFRALTVVDAFTRQCLAVEVDTSLYGQRVVRVLERLREEQGAPQVVPVDNGPEFRGKMVDQWAFEKSVKMHFIEPGKPTQNAHPPKGHPSRSTANCVTSASTWSGSRAWAVPAASSDRGARTTTPAVLTAPSTTCRLLCGHNRIYRSSWTNLGVKVTIRTQSERR